MRRLAGVMPVLFYREGLLMIDMLEVSGVGERLFVVAQALAIVGGRFLSLCAAYCRGMDFLLRSCGAMKNQR